MNVWPERDQDSWRQDGLGSAHGHLGEDEWARGSVEKDDLRLECDDFGDSVGREIGGNGHLPSQHAVEMKTSGRIR